MSDCVEREAVKEIVDYYKAINDGIFRVNESIDALPAVEPERAKGHWIPLTWEDEYKIVSDFPDDMDGTWVIVTDGKSISVERIKKDAYDHFFPSGRWFELDEVKAWMPLPESYKENETK